MAVNLRGRCNGLREAARRPRTGGRFINLSTSVLGMRLENYGIYAATRAAVEALTGILAKERRGRDITVNPVAPGRLGTALFLIESARPPRHAGGYRGGCFLADRAGSRLD